MLVQTEQDLETLNGFIAQNSLIGYDVESTGVNVRKDTIIGFAIGNESTTFYVPIYAYDTSTANLVRIGLSDGRIVEVLNSLKTKQLIMHNASFDTRITKHNLGVDLLPALHADTMLLKHTCDEEFPFGLKEIGAMLYGDEVKEEQEDLKASIKANSGTAKQYYKADVNILSRYAEQDIKLTYKIYNYYLRILKEEGLEDFFFEREVMPLYIQVTIPMEDRGIALDMPKLLEAQKNITTDLKLLEDQIQAQIAPHLDAIFIPWFLNKDYPLTTYKGNVTLLGRMFRNVANITELEFQKQAFAKDSDGQHMFNLQSKHHLKKLFFDTLNEEPLSRTPTGQPQVDEDFLYSIANKYDWVRLLIDYNKLTKLKGTYIDRFLEEQENGRYYPDFHQHRTVSGRLAGDMQQLPRPLESGQASEVVIRYTNLIREFIIASPGMVLVSADYEQLEPTIFSHTSGDPALQRIFNEGTDFYSTVAINVERHVGASAEKTTPNYLGKTNKAARQKAKAYALGIAYGMTGYKLKFELNCSEEEANKLVNDYLTAFPKLKEWIYASRDAIKATGRIQTQSGRVRHMPQAKAIFERYGSAIDNDLDLWKLYNKVPSVYAKAKADRKVYKNLMNNAVNFQVQGLAASIVNRAAIELAKFGMVPICQVHDELVYELPNDGTLEANTMLIKQIMENIVKLSVPLRTVPQIGKNYRECK